VSIHCVASRVAANGVEKISDVIKIEENKKLWLEDK